MSIALLGSASCFADKETRPLAEKIAESVDNGKQIMEQSLNQMKKSFAGSGFGKDEKFYEGLSKILMKHFPTDKIKKATADFYEQNFDKKELEELVSIMQKPVIQKQMAKMPKLQENLMGNMGEYMANLQTDMQQYIQKYALEYALKQDES